MKNRNTLIFCGIMAVLLIIPLFTSDPFVLRIVTECFMWIGMAITWDVMAGYTGYLNFGHGAFFGIGAYVTAILMMKYGWSFAATLPAAGLVAGLAAVIAGLPTLRLKGAQVAMAK